MSESAFAPWIGRQEETHDQLSRNLVKRIAATFGEPTPAHGEALPPLWHWAFFQDPVEAAGLGVDGHPARGGFLPPADDRNRMWAGGRLEFHQPLRVGGEASRTSTILRVEEKHGRSGALLFVTLRHDYRQDGQLALSEEHDIVYREPTPPKLGSTEALPEGDWREALEPDPVLLFRYSAVTFNGHRIHYDCPDVTDAEGYPGRRYYGGCAYVDEVEELARERARTLFPAVKAALGDTALELPFVDGYGVEAGLLLDVAAKIAMFGVKVLYVTGEESAGQVRLRAERINALADSLLLAAETDLGSVLGMIESEQPELLVVDSIQTLASSEVEGIPGGVTQVREVASALIREAKARSLPTVLVGHITKDGTIAGPRLLEHLVDVVITFEGERHSRLRMVRAVKNRYGPTDEVGCFEQTADGIAEVPDPSGLFLSHRDDTPDGVIA